jgi:DNA polymerase
MIDPPVIATLGSVALNGIKVIESHQLTLKANSGEIADWHGRKLVPLYHPSPQVIAAQRGLELQLQHFQTLGKLLKMKSNGS